MANAWGAVSAFRAPGQLIGNTQLPRGQPELLRVWTFTDHQRGTQRSY